MSDNDGFRPGAIAALRMLGVSAFLARGRPIAPDMVDAIMEHQDNDTLQDAMPLLTTLAAQGNPVSQHLLATLYDFGHGVKVRKRRAIALYTLAAKGGDLNAIYNLAASYHYGDGIPVDEARAMGLYERAAECGHVKAMNNLAFLLNENSDADVDLAEAVRWYRASADTGNANGMFRLAELLEAGRGCEQDEAAAAKLYGQAAEAGHEEARVAFAVHAAQGHAEGLSVAEGMKLCEDLAEEGSFIATGFIAHCYHTGKGVEQDSVKAYGLLSVGLANAVEEPDVDIEVTVTHIRAIQDGMSDEQVEQGRAYVIEKTGYTGALILRHIYLRRIEEPDQDEHDQWQWLAVENGAGSKSYMGLMNGRPYYVEVS